MLITGWEIETLEDCEIDDCKIGKFEDFFTFVRAPFNFSIFQFSNLPI